MTISGVFAWQRTHGGLGSNEFATEEQFVHFDRLMREHHGCGVSVRALNGGPRAAPPLTLTSPTRTSLTRFEPLG
jgi:hypothetical protein